MPSERSIVSLTERSLPASIGNKASNLRKLLDHGIRIPVTYVCTWEAHHRYIDNDASLVDSLRGELIRKLDVPVRQVMIESRIVNASREFAKNLGVRFGVAGTHTVFGVNTSTGSVQNTVGGTGINNPINGTAVVDNALVDLGAAAIGTSPPGALGMTLAKGADYVLNLEITALQNQQLGELISNPRVMTTDRCQATIKQGTQIPYQTSSGNTGPVTQLIDAVLQLDVLPQITPDGSVIMALKITHDAPIAASR